MNPPDALMTSKYVEDPPRAIRPAVAGRRISRRPRRTGAVADTHASSHGVRRTGRTRDRPHARRPRNRAGARGPGRNGVPAGAIRVVRGAPRAFPLSDTAVLDCITARTSDVDRPAVQPRARWSGVVAS